MLVVVTTTEGSFMQLKAAANVSGDKEAPQKIRLRTGYVKPTFKE